MSVAQFEDSPERLRQYVPDAYSVAQLTSIIMMSRVPQVSGKAAFLTWSYVCDSAAIAATSAGPTTLSLVGVVIERPDGLSGGGPAIFDHYVVAAFASEGKVADALTAAGFPTRHSPRIDYERELDPIGNPKTATAVPGPHGFTFTSTPGVNDTLRPGHSHNNSFWFGEHPETAAELEIRLAGAQEWLCVEVHCGSVSAPADRKLAEFFGAPSRTDASFSADHLQLDAVSARIRPAR